MGRKTPDEFAVMKRQPLSMPPEYNIEPPEPGKEPLKQPNPEKKAKQAIFGQTDETPSNISGTDNTFLDELGTGEYNPNIRGMLEDELINDPANNKYLIDGLMFWGDKDNSVVIDNLEEAQRLKSNERQGLRVDEGNIPILNPKK